MKFNRNLLSEAVRFGLVAGAVGVVGLTAAPAFAQDSEGEEAATLSRVTVTGSRIRRVDAETSQPVFVMDRADIDAQGLTSIGDVIQNLSANGSALNSTFNNGATAKPTSACATSAPAAPWCWSTAVVGSVAPASVARSI